MSALAEMYNWNGDYKLNKELKNRRYKVSDLDYPEYLHIFIDEYDNCEKYIRYSVFDEKFGYPALANTHNGEHSIKIRARVVDILNKLEVEGYIEKI